VSERSSEVEDKSFSRIWRKCYGQKKALQVRQAEEAHRKKGMQEETTKAKKAKIGSYSLEGGITWQDDP